MSQPALSELRHSMTTMGVPPPPISLVWGPHYRKQCVKFYQSLARRPSVSFPSYAFFRTSLSFFCTYLNLKTTCKLNITRTVRSKLGSYADTWRSTDSLSMLTSNAIGSVAFCALFHAIHCISVTSIFIDCKQGKGSVSNQRQLMCTSRMNRLPLYSFDIACVHMSVQLCLNVGISVEEAKCSGVT